MKSTITWPSFLFLSSLLILAFIIGCNPQPNKISVEPINENKENSFHRNHIRKYVDKEHGVVCYSTIYNANLSCVKVK